MWHEATAPLTIPFSTEAQEVNQFCEKLMERADKSGWNAQNAEIIIIADANGNNCNLITQYAILINIQEEE